MLEPSTIPSIVAECSYNHEDKKNRLGSDTSSLQRCLNPDIPGSGFVMEPELRVRVE